VTPPSPQSGETPLDELRTQLDGDVIEPGDPDYDDARAVFFTGIDRRPAAIARVANADDVARVVSLARDSGLELAVRGGAHSYAGYGTSDGGIVLDLSRMRALEVDADARTAWAETGMTAGEYTAAVGADGLATGFGDTGSVGIGGITLAGGVGFLVRKHGLTIDDVLAAEIVTADGEIRQADAGTNPDLYWAIRGGGGNFGVVTRLQLRLHELDGIVGGMLMLPATPEVVTGFLSAAEAAPEELSTIANVVLAPPMPFVPAEHHGRPIVMALMAYAGSPADGERAIAPLRALATPLADMVRPMSYPEIYELTKDAPHPVGAAARNMLVDGVDGGGAEAIVAHLERATAPMAAAQLRVLGGAMARVPDDATAFAHRGRGMMVNVIATYEHADEIEEREGWVTSLSTAVRQGDAGAYVGFMADEGEARVREAYPPAVWDRLVEIKARYDPANLFRLNQNVPATEG
jgi:FAD/FMN-containing dehydrogenase